MAQINPINEAQPEPVKEDAKKEGWTPAVILFGVISVLNAAVPALLYWLYIYQTKPYGGGRSTDCKTLG